MPDIIQGARAKVANRLSPGKATKPTPLDTQERVKKLAHAYEEAKKDNLSAAYKREKERSEPGSRRRKEKLAALLEAHELRHPKSLASTIEWEAADKNRDADLAKAKKLAGKV